MAWNIGALAHVIVAAAVLWRYCVSVLHSRSLQSVPCARCVNRMLRDQSVLRALLVPRRAFFVLPAEDGGAIAAAVLVAAPSGDAKRTVILMTCKSMKPSRVRCSRSCCACDAPVAMSYRMCMMHVCMECGARALPPATRLVSVRAARMCRERARGISFCFLRVKLSYILGVFID